jgi:hypothetical protein
MKRKQDKVMGNYILIFGQISYSERESLVTLVLKLSSI